VATQGDKKDDSADDEDMNKKKGPASPLQDYIIVSGQNWLDGIANGDGTVPQFIAMPFGSGYSVESQITGQDTTGGIQLEITLYNTPLRGPPVTLNEKPYQIFVKSITGETFTLLICETATVGEVKDIIAYQQIWGTFRDFYLIFNGI
jgi:hypothetical protein